MCENTSVKADKHYCISAWRSLIEQLHKLNSFRVNTGNINNYVELKQKNYKNSAEELCACLQLQFCNLPEDAKIGENETLLLADRKHRDTQYDRDDLKITLKLFIKNFKFEMVQEAIEATMNTLQINEIELLILAFPLPNKQIKETEICCQNGESSSSKVADINFTWFSDVLQLWNKLETEFVLKKKVYSIGVADFQLEALKKLYDAVCIKPCVNHLNFDKCCEITTELQNFAREHDIQLLTHNDLKPFPLKDVFHSFCNCNKNEKENKCSTFVPVWAARYTVWVRRRSLIASKGYIVQFRSARLTESGIV